MYRDLIELSRIMTVERVDSKPSGKHNPCLVIRIFNLCSLASFNLVCQCSFATSLFSREFFIPPQTKLRGYIVILMSVRSFVRPSVRPSQSLIRYSSKTAEHNFMKLSGIVHYMMPYCTSYFKFLSA